VARADTFGLFTYVDNGTSITITDYPNAETGAVIIPDTINGKPVTAIGAQAFDFCNGITSVSIPLSVTTIGNSAFLGCSAMVSAPIPSGVNSLGTQAFYQCVGLTAMTIPNGVSDVSDSLFDGCTSLASVTFSGNVTRIGNFSFQNCSSLTSIVLPSTVNSLGNSAFSRCSNLESVSLPGALASIGTNAFADCAKLATINLSATALTSMGAGAFAKCNSLTAVALPATLASIPSLAFDACVSLSSVTIPEGVVAIGSGAFRLCSALSSVHLPASLTTVDCLTSNNGQPFNRCGNLTSITVSPANVYFASVGGVLFSANKTQLYAYPAGLTASSYAIPPTVQTIKHSALRGCKFTTLTISSSASTIESSAFSTCSQLVSATFAGNAPASFGSSVFNAAGPGFTVYFYPGATGFTSPTWKTYSSAQIGSLTPVQTWLQSHGFTLDVDLASDPDGDGVSILMAYALNLDPRQNLGGSMPVPVLASGQLSMSFYAGTSGVIYQVETSTDMVNWSSSGVTIFAPDANGVRLATVNANTASRFMRLVVTH